MAINSRIVLAGGITLRDKWINTLSSRHVHRCVDLDLVSPAIKLAIWGTSRQPLTSAYWVQIQFEITGVRELLAGMMR